MKKKLIQKLWDDLARDKQSEVNFKIRNGKKLNIGFVNQYKLHKFIPNKWFDWERRVDARLMIIGQDWGPYKALLPYIIDYEKEKNKSNFDYDKFLFKTFSSRTEKFIMKAIESTYLNHYNKKITNVTWNNFLFTVAVFFTRQGTRFRGNEFYDEKFGVKISLPYLKRQIEIIKPKVIMPLGNTAWSEIQETFELRNYPLKISEVIAKVKNDVIKTKNTIIIPNFHPASHTDPNVQLKIWRKIWKYK